MRRADNTIVFGSQGAPASVQPVSVSRGAESQWFKTPVVPAVAAMRPMEPIGADVMPERYGFIAPRPARGLVFAAISLALIGVAAAGTYFVLGFETTAQMDTPAAVSTTTVTNADVHNAIPAPEPAPTPAAVPTDLPWEPPVVDAVKSPQIPKKVEGAQLAPVRRVDPVAPAPAKKSEPSIDDAIDRAGFYRNTSPTPAPDPSPPTTPTTERVPPVGEPAPAEPTPAPSPAPSDVLPDMQIKP